MGTWRFTLPSGKGVAQSATNEGIVKMSFDTRGWGHIQGSEKGKRSRTTPFRFFVTTGAKASFLNVQPLDEKTLRPKPHATYVFYKYRVAHDLNSVQLSSLSFNLIEAAVTAGKLKGKLNKDPKQNAQTGVTLEDSGENILKFIEAQPDQKVFETYGTLRKLP